MIKPTPFEFKTSKASTGVTFVAISCGVSLPKESDVKVPKNIRMRDTKVTNWAFGLFEQIVGCRHTGNVPKKYPR